MTLEFYFEPMSERHRKEIIDIYNHYIENSFAAYPDKKVEYVYFDRFLDLTRGYPALVVLSKGRVVGFCFLRAYNTFPTFRETAEITYFLHPDFKGKGIGRAALDHLEQAAKRQGIQILLANISSLNQESLVFHQKNGFKECGRFEKIIKKNGKQFDVVWVQKFLE